MAQQSTIITVIAIIFTITYAGFFFFKVIPKYDDNRIFVSAIVMTICGVLLAFFIPLIVIVTAVFLFLASFHVFKNNATLLAGIILYFVVVLICLLFFEAA